MANGNGPTGSEWGELRGDVKHIAEVVARIDETVTGDHDKVIKTEAWRDAHEKTHMRERGILAGLSVIGTAAASVLAWFK